jgi:hypothetical protein
VDRPGKGPWKARHPGNRREIRQFVRGVGFVNRPRGHGLRGGLRAGDTPAVGHGGGARRQLGQTEARETESGARAARDRARQIVGGAARRADKDDLGAGRIVLEETGRGR